MSSPSPHEQEALDWVIRHDRGLTPEEQDRFFDWLAADDRHPPAFERASRDWDHFDCLEDWRPAHSARPNPDLLDSSRLTRQRRWRLVGTLAAVLVIALGLGGTLFFSGQTPNPEEIAVTELQYTRLPDGSELDLKEGSRYRVAFTPEERRVHLLAGEAYFSVVDEPGRPFIVETDRAWIRAIGTAFNVSVQPERFKVLVTEGVVEVDDPQSTKASGSPAKPDPRLSLKAGEQAVWEPDRASVAWIAEPMSEAEIAEALAWKPEVFEFNGTPLSQALDRFAEHHPVTFRFDDPALKDTPIMGAFRSNNLNGFLRLLELTVSVKAERLPDGRIRLYRVPGS
ncbi:MAG: FecR family protein [Opitutales bacterium]